LPLHAQSACARHKHTTQSPSQPEVMIDELEIFIEIFFFFSFLLVTGSAFLHSAGVRGFYGSVFKVKNLATNTDQLNIFSFLTRVVHWDIFLLIIGAMQRELRRPQLLFIPLGYHDNFQHLGGSSVHAMRLFHRHFPIHND
jgi:hypothetical protein